MADQQSPPETIALAKFAGLVNTVKPERLDPNELLRAVNVDIDDRDQIHRRRGYRKVLSGNCHSLFAGNDGTVYAVVDGNLCIVNPNFTTIILKFNVGSLATDPLAYVQVGDVVYFSCANGGGKIVNREAVEWGETNGDRWLSPVVNPTTTLFAVRGKLLGKPPNATILTYFNGRIYMANGRQVWATELYLYDYVDKTRTYWTFESDVTMIGAVTDGLYIGTSDGVYFMTGPTYDKMKRAKVMDSGVIPGSMVELPAELANPPQVPADADTPAKVSIGFMTTAGFCVAQEQGQATNLTEAKYFFSESVRVAAMFRRMDGMNHYVAVSDSGGSPTSSARIGDYVDATLIRNGVVVD